MEKHNIIFL